MTIINTIFHILAACWNIFQEAAIYMLLGFFVAGILYVYVKPEKISRYLGQGKIRSVFFSALVGIPLPLCSCGVVPAAAGLKRQGANNGATLSFLIATPESGMDSIPVTYALMDPIITVARPLAAFVTAMVAGITANLFGSSAAPPAPEQNACTPGGGCGCGGQALSAGPEPSLTAKILAGLKYAFVDLLGDIGKWFLVGILMAGLISYFVPDTLFTAYLENDFVAMLVMLVVGLPMYVCATASTPIAAAMVLKGLNPGAALVFLLAGPATNIATLSMVGGMLGKRALAIYLGSIVVCSLALGMATDMLYYVIGISAQAVAGQTAEIIPYPVQLTAAALLAALLAVAMWKQQAQGNSCTIS